MIKVQRITDKSLNNFNKPLKGQKQPKPRTEKQKRRRKANREARELATDLAGLAITKPGAKLGRMAVNAIGRKLKGREKRLPSPYPTMQQRVILSGCCWKLLQAYIDPFSIEARGVCLPQNNIDPTFKSMGYMRGIGSIGTLGMGYVAFAPCLNNDYACIYASTVDYANLHLGAPANNNPFSFGGNAWQPRNSPMHNNPYTLTQLTVNGSDTNNNSNHVIIGRVVLASLKAFYVGEVTKQAGLIIGYVDPSRDGVLGTQPNGGIHGNGYTMDRLMSFDAADIEYNTSKGMQIVFAPHDNEDGFTTPASLANNDFIRAYPMSRGLPYVSSNVGIHCGEANGVIMVTGTPGQSFYYEAVVHAEYKGPGVHQGLLTNNEVDSVGTQIVQDLIGQARRVAAGRTDYSFGRALTDLCAQQRITGRADYLRSTVT